MSEMIFKPKGVLLPDDFKERLTNLILSNPHSYGISCKQEEAITNLRKLFTQKSKSDCAQEIMDQLNLMKIKSSDELVININTCSVVNDAIQPFFINRNSKSVTTSLNAPFRSRIMPSVTFVGTLPIWSTYTNFRNTAFPCSVEFVTEFLATKNILEILMHSPSMFELLYSDFFTRKNLIGLHMIMLFPHKDACVFNKDSFYEQDHILYTSNYFRAKDENTIKGDMAKSVNTSRPALTVVKKYGTFSIQPNMGFTISRGKFQVTQSSFVDKGFCIDFKSRTKSRFKFSKNHSLFKQTNDLKDEVALAKFMLIPRMTNILDYPLNANRFKIVRAFPTGLLIENMDNTIKKWISPIELTYNFNISNSLE